MWRPLEDLELHLAAEASALAVVFPDLLVQLELPDAPAVQETPALPVCPETLAGLHRLLVFL